jgi:hypothetical protein
MIYLTFIYRLKGIKLKLQIHRITSILATLCIATFFSTTLFAELFGTDEMIVMVKGLIVMPGIFILVPAMAIAGATGFSLAKNRKGKLVENKKKRMPIIRYYVANAQALNPKIC